MSQAKERERERESSRSKRLSQMDIERERFSLADPIGYCY